MAGILACAMLAAAGCANTKGWVGMHLAAPSRPSKEDVDALGEAVNMVAELRYDEAADEFARLGPRFDESNNRDRAAECGFWQGYCREKQGRTLRAGELYRRTVETYPQTRAAERAIERLQNLGPLE